jgi:hypothetical protein
MLENSMAYFSGNARLRASALDVIKSYEVWTPFDVVGARVVAAPSAPTFFRLRHIAFLELSITIATDWLAPPRILVSLPSAITNSIARFEQVSPALSSRHGVDVVGERWISTATATVDTSVGTQDAFYIIIESEGGFLQDRSYDITAQLQLELA